VVELLIGFDRPESLPDSELRSWIDERDRTGRPALALGRAVGGRTSELLWVTAASDAMATAEDQVADLILDMRLLGLRPTVVAHPSTPQASAGD
jgi:hypothetical protein